MTIGQVAARVGVPAATVRYYEQRKLLAAPPRSRAGYRIYGPEAVERLRFIKRAQSIGFSLDEIQELLAINAEDREACPRVVATARERIRIIDERLRELRTMRRQLEHVIHVCEEGCVRCPVLAPIAAPVRAVGAVA
ncbi:MAG TPA: heavy metal-responsive transcriptional regulator [Gemmatimonadaceae bacterium]|nr:heavy metal-responsive transcriptional regulator [Gemmatimonadaceae bacterium]